MHASCFLYICELNKKIGLSLILRCLLMHAYNKKKHTFCMEKKNETGINARVFSRMNECNEKREWNRLCFYLRILLYNFFL